MSPPPDDTYRLNPHLRLAAYADRYFVYDARASDSPLVEIPTTAVAPGDYAALDRLKFGGYFIEPRSRNDILAYFKEEGLDAALFDSFLRQDFLKRYISPGQSIQRKVVDYFERRYRPTGSAAKPPVPGPFDETDAKVFGARTFFNLPHAIDAAACQVGLLGFPHASLDISAGTAVAPDLLRLLSRQWTWFDVHKLGVYSETATPDGRPSVLCRGAVVRDAGNLDCEGATLAEMLAQVKAVLTRDFFEPGVFPIVVGGDHAITYPIMLAYLAARPDIGLLHLDAHNDAFYTSQVAYSHAAPLSNLLRRTPITTIASFGLRTVADRRAAVMEQLYASTGAAERLRLFPLMAVKQMLTDPRTLETALSGLAGRPYYLTLDLDVLADTAIGGRVSTPHGAGLEWHELYQFLIEAFRHLNIVGCDIVEYNALNGAHTPAHQLNALLLLLIDLLASNNPKRVPSSAAASRQDTAPTSAAQAARVEP